MKLPFLGEEETYFDEFPKHAKPNQKVFLTHLFNVNALRLAQLEIMPEIYTSITLGAQLQMISRRNTMFNINQLRPRLHLLTFYKSILIRLSDESVIRVIALGSDEDYTPHIMLLIQKDENMMPHLYAGICPYVRGALMKRTIAPLLRKGVENVYIDLKRATEVHDSRALHKLTAKIENILETHCRGRGKLQIIIPIFGYEALTSHLCDEIPATIYVEGVLSKIFLTSRRHYALNSKSAKIIIKSRDLTIPEIKELYLKKEHITIKIVDRAPLTNNVNEFGYCELYWSPLPAPAELKKIIQIIEPKEIVPIVHKNMVPPQVPKYLLDLCSKNKGQTGNAPSNVGGNKFLDAFAVQKRKMTYLDDDDDSQNCFY